MNTFSIIMIMFKFLALYFLVEFVLRTRQIIKNYSSINKKDFAIETTGSALSLVKLALCFVPSFIK